MNSRELTKKLGGQKQTAIGCNDDSIKQKADTKQIERNVNNNRQTDDRNPNQDKRNKSGTISKSLA